MLPQFQDIYNGLSDLFSIHTLITLFLSFICFTPTQLHSSPFHQDDRLLVEILYQGKQTSLKSSPTSYCPPNTIAMQFPVADSCALSYLVLLWNMSSFSSSPDAGAAESSGGFEGFEARICFPISNLISN